ncbi:hypothetical protein BKA64DRAFT_664044 [Cadophora sp. MPI-SDFR-AT-0126]|nr:hypothetical protein BKA64DRAFT_664044 [Leotiomycetes sp. MPI-SDFR-AT-0126]
MSHLDFFDVASDVNSNRDTPGPTWNQCDHDSISASDEPTLIYPAMDMSTALQTSSVCASPRNSHNPVAPSFTEEAITTGDSNLEERIDLAPKLYACAVRSSILPCRQLQNELVTLYFRHIHPMLPGVDEHHFSTLHRNFRGREEFMEPGDFLIYLAILAAGFGHLSEIQLHRTPYRSLHDGQGALFDQVKVRYWSAVDIDPVLLTQVTLIISLWSPAPPAPIQENNSFWVDLAFKHANTAKLWDTRESGSSADFYRRRVLWWCCIVRDRHLAVVLRRPYRLHHIPAITDLPSKRDFGIEAMDSSFVELSLKHLAILSFVWFCRLSEIMARIANFQRQFRFSLEWNGAVDGPSGFAEIYELDRQLGQWRSSFENAVAEENDVSQVVFAPSVTLLRMISYSLVTVLYQFYFLLHRRDIEGAGLKPDPLERMKDASYRVALSLEVVRANDGSDDIPLWVLGWFVLPLAVYQVSEQMEANLPLKDVLMFFMKRLTRRCSGAHTISQTVIKVVKAVAERVNASASIDSSGMLTDMSPNGTVREGNTSALNSARWQREAKILAISLGLCDPALEHNAIPDQSKVAESCG